MTPTDEEASLPSSQKKEILMACFIYQKLIRQYIHPGSLLTSSLPTLSPQDHFTSRLSVTTCHCDPFSYLIPFLYFNPFSLLNLYILIFHFSLLIPVVLYTFITGYCSKYSTDRYLLTVPVQLLGLTQMFPTIQVMVLFHLGHRESTCCFVPGGSLELFWHTSP